MKFKDYIWIFAFLAFISLAFLFELVNKKSTPEKEIEFWQYWSGEEKKPIEALVNKFNFEKHGFKVKMLTVSMPRKKILMAVAGNVAPDLIHLDGDMVTDFALRNALTELNLSKQVDIEKFTPIYIKMLNLHGKQYALPLMPTCEAMHVNENLLAKYGEHAPETLDDIVRIFDRMGRIENGRITNFTDITYLPSWPPWVGTFIPVVFGGHWAIKDAHGNWTITANAKENIEAWTWVLENFASKIPPEKLAAFTEGFHSYQSPDNPFYVGRIAIENNGVWERNLAKIFAPDLKVLVKAFPGRIPMATYVTVDALAIPRGAKHSKEAFEFMAWLLKQENLEYLALKQKKFTPLKNHSAEFFAQHENPYIKTFIDLAQSPNAVYFPQLSFVSKYKREIKDAYLRVLRQELSPEAALDGLQEKFGES